MATVLHHFEWHLDTGVFIPGQVNLTRGYQHDIYVKSYIAGVEQEPTALTLKVGDAFPLDSNHTRYTQSAFDWDATEERWKTTVNASIAPLSTLGTTDVAVSIAITVDSTVYTHQLHAGFLGSSPPIAVDNNGSSAGHPTWFQRFLKNNWPPSFLSLSDLPSTIPTYQAGEVIGAQFPTITGGSGMVAADADPLTDGVIIDVAGYDAQGDGGGGQFVLIKTGSPPSEDSVTIFHASNGGGTVGYYKRI
jgi:hypothetical protein